LDKKLENTQLAAMMFHRKRGWATNEKQNPYLSKLRL